MPIDNAETFAQWLLEKFDLNGETVMVAPAAGFYSTRSFGINQIRIAGRSTQGVSIFKIPDSDRIVNVSRVQDLEQNL